MIATGLRLSVEHRWDWEGARQRCLALAVKLLRSRDDAEDAVQEAMVRGFRHASACRDLRDPLPWLITITRRECARIARRRGERPVAALEACAEYGDGHDTSGTVVSIVDMWAAVARLSEQDRLIFDLRYLRHLSQADVATITGLPEGTIKTRLHRIRARVRSGMEVA